MDEFVVVNHAICGSVSIRKFELCVYVCVCVRADCCFQNCRHIRVWFCAQFRGTYAPQAVKWVQIILRIEFRDWNIRVGSIRRHIDTHFSKSNLAIDALSICELSLALHCFLYGLWWRTCTSKPHKSLHTFSHARFSFISVETKSLPKIRKRASAQCRFRWKSQSQTHRIDRKRPL